MNANATESYGKPSLQSRTSVDHSIRVTSGRGDVVILEPERRSAPAVMASCGRDGSFANFDPQGSVATLVTQPLAINPAGAITGYYLDANGGYHGFIRTPKGTLTTIDAFPNATFTFALAINPAGTIVGFYNDTIFTLHGFILPPAGHYPPPYDRSPVPFDLASVALTR